MLIGLTYDIRIEYLAEGYSEEETAEFDKPETIDGIEEALRQLGHQTERIGHVRSLVRMLGQGKRWDLVFNICEGLQGFARESEVPAILDAYRIPYTFSDPTVTMYTLHKATAKSIVRAAGGRTADFCVVERPADVANVNLEFPIFAKPIAEGTGKGISGKSLVSSPEELRETVSFLLEKFNQPVLLESYLPGREFTIGICGTGEAARSLGILEIHIRTKAEKSVYSYNNKANYEDHVEYTLLKDEPELIAEIERQALIAWNALGCRDAGRLDLRSDNKGQPNFLEVNPMAGMNPEHSDLPILCRQAGMSFVQLVGAIVDSASSRVA
jgi:D-alanine-D-alanine ligase